MNPDPLESPILNRLQLFLILTPFLGFLMALWTLYRGQGTQEQRVASRLMIVLTFLWLLGHLGLEAGALSLESWTFPLLVTSSVFTTTYFLTSLGLMIRVWKRQTIWLPGLSPLTEKISGKHLS